MRQPELLDSLSEFEFREAIERAGGEQAVLASMSATRQASDRLNAEYEKLLEQYPRNWVAVGPDGLIAHVPVPEDSNGEHLHREALESLEALIDQLNQAENNHSGYIVRYLDPNPKKLLL